MIEETIKIHDKYQFEVKLNYKLEQNKKYTDYTIDTYIFIPDSLDINSNTYKKTDFYNNIQSYIRFKTPTVLLQNIANGTNSPLEILKNKFEEIVKENNKDKLLNYEHQIQMFCSILKSSIRDYVYFITEKKVLEDIKHLLNNYIDNLKDVSLKYRQLRTIITVPTISDKEFIKYCFGDEYISLTTEFYSYELYEYIEKSSLFDDEFKKFYQKKLIEIVQFETNYRKQHNYTSIKEKNSDNEEFTYRKSVLKKYIASILYLNTRIKEEGKFIEQLLYSIAAGVAMIFATGAAFLSQQTYGNLTYPFFVALVVSYMFKDRIKELMRIYFNSKIHKNLFDHKTNIYSENKNKLGISKERVTFLKKNHLSPSIIKVRNIDHITELDNRSGSEDVIFYRKYIKIHSNEFKKYYNNFPMEGINDIIRFSITDFLKRMDNPEVLLHYYEDENYKRIVADKVYHVNMIIKYKLENEESFKRFRIVLNRNGIKRIEKIEKIG